MWDDRRVGIARDPIADLVHRYADAVVHFDADLWGETWARDAVWQPAPDRRVEGRDAIVEQWRHAMVGYDAVIHVVLNGTHGLDAGDERGVGRWYLNECTRRPDGESTLLLAHYDDEYVRVDGRWRFARRELAVHYRGAPDMGAPFLNAWVGDS